MPGADRLGERRRVDDAVVAVEREHRRQRLAGEADRDVRVVLEDHEVVVVREVQQPLALLARERVPGGVLEVRDDVRELRARALGEQPLELVDVDAVLLERDHADVRAALLEAEQRAVVGRALDDDRVAVADELVEEERVGLHRPVGDEDVSRARRRAARRSTCAAGRSRSTCRRRSCRRGRSRTPRPRTRLQPVDVDDVERGRSAREGDGVTGSHAAGDLGHVDHERRPARRRRPAARPSSNPAASSVSARSSADSACDVGRAPRAGCRKPARRRRRPSRRRRARLSSCVERARSERVEGLPRSVHAGRASPSARGSPPSLLVKHDRRPRVAGDRCLRLGARPGDAGRPSPQILRALFGRALRRH